VVSDDTSTLVQLTEDVEDIMDEKESEKIVSKKDLMTEVDGGFRGIHKENMLKYTKIEATTNDAIEFSTEEFEDKILDSNLSSILNHKSVEDTEQKIQFRLNDEKDDDEDLIPNESKILYPGVLLEDLLECVQCDPIKFPSLKDSVKHQNLLNAPLQPPKNLCIYDQTIPIEIRLKMIEMNQKSFFDQNQLKELKLKVRKFNEKNKEKMKNISCLNGKLAFSKQICRFQLPCDLRKLKNLTPANYLTNYTVIDPRRKKLYSSVFDQNNNRRKSKNRHSVSEKDPSVTQMSKSVHFSSISSKYSIFLYLGNDKKFIKDS